MTLCIAGKNLVAVEVLAGAADMVEDVVCLPNPDDRGVDGWQPSLRLAAERLGIPIVGIDALYGDAGLCFLSLEYAVLIRPERFRTANLINLHFSLLPKYRGSNTAVWPILNGETEHGVTLHLIDAGMDTGPIIDQRAFCLNGMTAYDAYMSCQREGIALAMDWLPRLIACDYVTRPQVGEGSAYLRKQLDYGLKEIDLNETSEQVLRRIRAFTFPAYQLPTLGGREILEAANGRVAGWDSYPTADGWISLRIASLDAS